MIESNTFYFKNNKNLNPDTQYMTTQHFYFYLLTQWQSAQYNTVVERERNKTPNILFLGIFQQYPPNIPSLQPLYLSPLPLSPFSSFILLLLLLILTNTIIQTHIHSPHIPKINYFSCYFPFANGKPWNSGRAWAARSRKPCQSGATSSSPTRSSRRSSSNSTLPPPPPPPMNAPASASRPTPATPTPTPFPTPPTCRRRRATSGTCWRMNSTNSTPSSLRRRKSTLSDSRYSFYQCFVELRQDLFLFRFFRIPSIQW